MSDLKNKFRTQTQKKIEEDPQKAKGVRLLKDCLSLLLKNVTHKDFDIRRASVETLIQFKHDRVADFILRAYQADNLSSYLSLALGKISSTETIDKLVKSLADSNPAIRANAAVALGQVKDPRASEVLRELLGFYFSEEGTPPPGLSEGTIIAALQGLGQIADKGSLPILRELFRKEPNPKIKATAAITLGLIQSTEIYDIAAIAILDSDFRVQANAVEIFKNNPRPFREKLIPLLESPNNRVSGNAAMILFAIPEERAKLQKHLLTMSQNGEKWPRCTACFVMGECRDAVFSKSLTAILDGDSDQDVRRHAAMALEKIKDPEASLSLIVHYEKESVKGTRKAIIRALASCQKMENRGQLLEMFRAEKDPELVGTWVETLKGVGDRHMAQTLVDYLKRTEPEIVLPALKFVGEHTLASNRSQIIPQINGLVHSEHRAVRSEAIRLLWSWGQLTVIDRVLLMLQGQDKNEMLLATDILREIANTLNLTLEEMGIQSHEAGMAEIFQGLRDLEKVAPRGAPLTPSAESPKTVPEIPSEAVGQKGTPPASLEFLELSQIENLFRANGEEAVGMKLGENYEKLGRHADAAGIYIKVLQKAPQNFKAFFLAGQCYFKLGEFRNAAKFLAKAVQFYPDLLPAYHLLVEALFQSRMIAEELHFLGHILQREPDNLTFIKKWIRSAMETGQSQEAMARLVPTVKLFPRDRELLFLLAQFRHLQGDRGGFPLLLRIIHEIRGEEQLKRIQALVVPSLFTDQLPKGEPTK